MEDAVRRRPGGRTERTGNVVRDAVRALAAEGAPFGVAEVAARSGVHATTVYRRWHSLEGLLLDVAAADLASSSPLVVTGDLRADLENWGHALAQDVATPGGLTFLTAMARAGREGADAQQLQKLMAPRLDQVTAILEASDTHSLTARDVVDLLVAPVYLAAVLGLATGPDGPIDVDVLVDNILAVRTHRDGRASHLVTRPTSSPVMP